MRKHKIETCTEMFKFIKGSKVPCYLLYKLESYGVKGKLLDLLTIFMSDFKG